MCVFFFKQPSGIEESVILIEKSRLAGCGGGWMRGGVEVKKYSFWKGVIITGPVCAHM